MAVTVLQFKAEFPEFDNTENAVIQSRLSMASRQINATVWGAKTNDGIKMLAAHLIALAPLGEQAKLRHENRGTIYGDQYEALKAQVAYGFRVV